MDRTEQQDYVELIAWIIKQPWCNGRVGGIGQSYYAMAQWLMATLNPPGLACIAPYDGLVDQYRCSNYHGGIFCNYRSHWYTSLRADNQHRPAGRTGRAADALRSRRRHHRAHARRRLLARALALLAARRHQGAGALDRALGQDGAASARQHPRLRAGARRRRSSSSPARKTVHEAHHQYDQVEFHEKELLPFYDLHLKGKNNGFMDGEPARLYVRGANVWREEDEWPLPRAKYVPYYLRKGPSGSVTSLNDGGLGPEAAGGRRRRDELHLSGLEVDQRRGGDRSGRTASIRCGACSPSPVGAARR